MGAALILFRNDLRIHDNENFRKALYFDEVIPLYCFDPRQFSKTSFGFNKTGPFRSQFLIQTVADLRNNIHQLGGELIVRMGKPEEIIKELAKTYSLSRILMQKEVTSEEIRVEKAIEQQVDVPVSYCWGSTLFHVNDIPYRPDEIPQTFTTFRKQTEKKSQVRNLIKPPDTISVPAGLEPGAIPDCDRLGVKIPETDDRAALKFIGGETRGLARLDEYFWREDKLKEYKFTRNGLMGSDYSSKFSPWLANGSLSPRKIYWEVKKYEQQRTENVSTYWMIFELIWRDFFRFSAAKYGDTFFRAGGIQEKSRSWNRDREQFQKWAKGKTGIPFIDANMRELNRTGFMSNRGRQNVASFLAQNLNIDWRMGAEYFESKLLDYDVCSNYGNWMYNATVGQDPRNRYFNIVGQAQKYDSNGHYVRLWVPELEKVPTEYIHEPHKMMPDQQKLYEVKIGSAYPRPMLDLEKSYEEIKERG